MMNKKDKICLKDINEEENKDLQVTANVMNLIDKEVRVIQNSFKGKNAHVRAFLAEVLLYLIFTSSKVSFSVIASILEKIKVTQLGIPIKKGQVDPKLIRKDYIG